MDLSLKISVFYRKRVIPKNGSTVNQLQEYQQSQKIKTTLKQPHPHPDSKFQFFQIKRFIVHPSTSFNNFMIVKLFGLVLLLVLASSTQIIQQRQVYNPNKKQLASTTPIKFIYIDVPTSWFGELTIPPALGVPGFANPDHPYNYVCLSFWTYPSTPVDSAGVWANISSKMGANAYGTTTQEIQATLKKNFTNAGVKLMISAFGSTQTPTTSKFDPVDTATQLAKFAVDNLFDGVDVDWEDTPSFQLGDRSGQNWLITFTQTLRQILPAGYIITHAPQAPYFAPYIQGDASLYPAGAYLTVDQEAGSLIDFYNIQFYNQGKGVYDYAEGLFNVSGGWAPQTSINEIIANGVPQNKVVLGKPVTTKNAHSGWMSATDLNNAIKANYAYNGWNTGVMFWQFKSDLDGSFCNAVLAGVPTMSQNIYEAKE